MITEGVPVWHTIKMANEFFPDINSGNKTATIRKGQRDYKLGISRVESTNPIGLDSGTIEEGKARTELLFDEAHIDIYEVIHKRFGDLTIEDAKIDNYPDVAKLKQVMLGFYPDLQDDDAVTIVKFKKA